MRALRITLVAVFTAVIFAAGFSACVDSPPSTEDGHDSDISDCCLGLVLPWRSSPQECLCKRTGDEIRWLTCLGGILEYRCDGRVP